MGILCRFQFRHRRAILIALLAHLLAIVALASAPSWHEAIHHDAGDHEHQCAITLFASGGCDDAQVVVFLVALVLSAALSQVAPRMVWVRKIFLVLRVWEHAPPAHA